MRNTTPGCHEHLGGHPRQALTVARDVANNGRTVMNGLVQRFDHFVVAVKDLEEACRRWRRLGLDVRPGGTHPGLGTNNAIVRFGADYIELLAVRDPAEARAGGLMAPVLSLLEHHSEAMAGLCLATVDIDALARALASAGLRYRGPMAMSRRRPDGRVLGWRLLVPEGGPWRRPVPFFIQWDDPDDVRLLWEQPGEHVIGAEGVAAVAVLVDDMAWAVSVYGQVLGLRPLGEDQVPGLGVRRARFSLDDCVLEVLSPAGPGEAREELDRLGPGPFRLCLRVRDMDRAWHHLAGATAEPLPEPGLSGAIRLSYPGLGVRLVLVGAGMAAGARPL